MEIMIPPMPLNGVSFFQRGAGEPSSFTLWLDHPRERGTEGLPREQGRLLHTSNMLPFKIKTKRVKIEKIHPPKKRQRK